MTQLRTLWEWRGLVVRAITAALLVYFAVQSFQDGLWMLGIILIVLAVPAFVYGILAAMIVERVRR